MPAAEARRRSPGRRDGIKRRKKSHAAPPQQTTPEADDSSAVAEPTPDVGAALLACASAYEESEGPTAPVVSVSSAQRRELANKIIKGKLQLSRQIVKEERYITLLEKQLKATKEEEVKNEAEVEEEVHDVN